VTESRALREKRKTGLGLNPRAFIPAVRWQVEDAMEGYPPHVLARLSEAERAELSRFNREYHGGSFDAAPVNLHDRQSEKQERWNAGHAAKRCVMSRRQYGGGVTLDMLDGYAVVDPNE